MQSKGALQGHTGAESRHRTSRMNSAMGEAEGGENVDHLVQAQIRSEIAYAAGWIGTAIIENQQEYGNVDVPLRQLCALDKDAAAGRGPNGVQMVAVHVGGPDHHVEERSQASESNSGRRQHHKLRPEERAMILSLMNGGILDPQAFHSQFLETNRLRDHGRFHRSRPSLRNHLHAITEDLEEQTEKEDLSAGMPIALVPQSKELIDTQHINVEEVQNSPDLRRTDDLFHKLDTMIVECERILSRLTALSNDEEAHLLSRSPVAAAFTHDTELTTRN